MRTNNDYSSVNVKMTLVNMGDPIKECIDQSALEGIIFLSLILF